MSSMNKFAVGQSVKHKGETTTIKGVNHTRKGKMYALENGEAAFAKDLSAVKADIKEGVVPKTFPVPRDKQIAAQEAAKEAEEKAPEDKSKDAKKTASKKSVDKDTKKDEKAE